MDAQQKPTLVDIAKMTNLSQASVSMILNENSGMSFSEETIKRVHEAVEKLHYTKPNQKGRVAKIFNKNTIVIFCPTITSPYYATLVQAIEQSARAKKFNTFIFNTYRDLDSELKSLSMIRNTDIAGIVFTFIPQASELIEEINLTIPVVVIGDRNNDVNVDTVEINNYTAGVIIAQHMIQLGHHHIAYISTTLNLSNSARIKRLQGLQDTFQKECPGGTVLVKSKVISPQDDLNNLLVEHTAGYELTKECLSQKKITAFVAVNDMVAYGVMDALQSENYKVPEDYSVCGFDNIFPSQFSSLSLTTVEHHILEKGHNAFDILFRKISNINSDGTFPTSITRVEYQHQLIVRNSTAPPRNDR
jgi:LacI family transcriptional regulator